MPLSVKENLKKGGKLETQDTQKSSILLSKAESKVSSLTSEIEELKNKNEQQKIVYQQKLEYVQAEVTKLKAEEEAAKEKDKDKGKAGKAKPADAKAPVKAPATP